MGKVATLLFLPGMMCDERLFSSQIATLRHDSHCLAVNFNQGDSIEGYAQQVLASLRAERERHLAEQSPVVLIGLSMGGIVAMECMRLAPERFDAVVLLDTNPLAEDPHRRLLRPSQIRRALEGELDTILIDEMKPLYLAPKNRSDESLLSLVLEMARSLGPDVFARQSKALMNRSDNTETLSAWAKPALILCGAHDNLCPPSRHRMMHSLMPQSELVEFPDAGHLPTLEIPDLVNKVLVSFIRKLSSS